MKRQVDRDVQPVPAVTVSVDELAEHLAVLAELVSPQETLPDRGPPQQNGAAGTTIPLGLIDQVEQQHRRSHAPRAPAAALLGPLLPRRCAGTPFRQTRPLLARPPIRTSMPRDASRPMTGSPGTNQIPDTQRGAAGQARRSRRRTPCQNRRMSPKSRGRKNKKKTAKRGGHPRHGGFTAAGATRAGQPPSTSGFGGTGRRAPAANSSWPGLQQMVAAGVPALYAMSKRFRPLLGSDDPLAVEEVTAELITQADQAEATSGLGLVIGVAALAARHPEPQVAAMACALDAFMPGMATGMALNDLARHGVPMPAWHNRLGAVVPETAWHYLDGYGEQRAVLATFSYGETPHTLVAVTSPWPVARVLAVQLLRSTGDELRQSITQNIEQRYGGPVVEEPLTPRELRGNLQVAAYRAPDDLDRDTAVALEILRQRLKTLPPPNRTPNPRQAVEAGPQPADHVDDAAHGRASRDAAIADFLSSTSAPTGVSDAVLGFWARVMAGATAVHAIGPTHVSPGWLNYLLDQYVPQTIELPDEARSGLRPAVTAWVRWASGQRSLTAEAIEALTVRVAELDEAFDPIYADPEMTALRCYLRDVVTTTVDGEDLRRAILPRATAVPLPRDRQPEDRHLLASEPDQRQQILASVLASWQLPPDHEQQWSGALHQISARLWSLDPDELTTAVANYLLSEGTDGLLLSDLTELTIEHASDAQAFMDAAIERVTVDDGDGEWTEEPDDD